MVFFSRKTPPSDDQDEDYVAPEIVAQRKRRRRWLVLLALIALAAIVIFFAARPLGRAIKGWQAERAAGQVDALLASQKIKEAQNKVQDALALSPGNQVAMRAAARFLSTVGATKDAAAFWSKVEKSLPLTKADERLYATALLSQGDVVEARRHLQSAWPAGTKGEPEDWLLALSMAMQKRDEAEALRLALQLIRDRSSSASQQLRAASLLAGASAVETRVEAWDRIRTISQQKDEAGLEAIVMLARRWAGNKQNSTSTQTLESELTPEELAVALETHPKTETKFRLLALDLRLIENPLRKDELVATAQKNFAGSDDDLQALTAWLYGKGEYRKVLDLLSEEVAVRRQTLFLQRLDTMAALGQWKEVRAAIQLSRFSLDRVTAELYIARCDEQLGNPAASGLHWQAALDAAEADPRQLGMVADYASKNGRLQIMETACRAMIKADPTIRGSYERLLQLYQAQRDTGKLRNVLQQMSEKWPDDEAILNDLAYGKLLQQDDEVAATGAAAKLFAKNPRSLPHRITLALAKYRAADFQGGLSLLTDIQGETAPLTGRLFAIKAALLWSLGRKEEALAVLGPMEVAQLLPEERQLVELIVLP